MPPRTLRPCSFPLCPELVAGGGRCSAHRYAGEAHKRKPGEKRFYDRRIWRDRIRVRKLRRDPLCEPCSERRLVVVATQVDHRDGDTSNNSDENLISTCAPCHSRKTVFHDGGFGREKQR